MGLLLTTVKYIHNYIISLLYALAKHLRTRKAHKVTMIITNLHFTHTREVGAFTKFRVSN